MSLGNWLRPLRRRQLFSAASASLKIMASAVLFERHPFDRTVRWRMVASELSMMLVVRRCFQCSAPDHASLSRPSDRGGRQPAGVLADQRAQRLLEIAGGDALQVEDRDQHFQ